MAINVQEILLTAVNTTVISGAAGWVIQSIINHGLSKDLEKFKADLQTTANVETEKLRHTLEKVAVEHKVRFTSLHEKRAEMIAEIHGHIVDAEQYGQRFAYVEGYEEREKRLEAYFDTMKKIVELYQFIEKKRIYLPEPICEQLKTFVTAVRKTVIRTNLFVPLEPRGANYEKLLEQKIKTITEVNEAFETSIPALREALEKEFRSILGAER